VVAEFLYHTQKPATQRAFVLYARTQSCTSTTESLPQLLNYSDSNAGKSIQFLNFSLIFVVIVHSPIAFDCP
ncbi:MAG: hypothetical protein ACP5R6_09145, partial [Chlorobaculum sp.]